MSALKKRIIIKKGDDSDSDDEISNLDFDFDSDCCGEGQFQRQYLTKAEQTAELEAYLADLKLEVQAVEEHLVDLAK